ncbi:fructosamine-3-kinase [Aplysia californica]|uniref:protein-ribulosamine 3-kinase n=1 Tax=Aplysia californica TaxID=6500 RepID=A0ABM1VUT1_APLCA|nr:fructosamine-3-kinase [Aplysia californica]
MRTAVEESVDEQIKQELGTSILRQTGYTRKGAICEGRGFETDRGRVFIKFTKSPQAFDMFQGEFESLLTLKDTGVVKVPSPIKVIAASGGPAALVMEFTEFKHLSKWTETLGEQMARLHLHNSESRTRAEKAERSIHKDPTLSFIEKFGFPTSNYFGFFPQDNEWSDSWLAFFARKIEQHIKLVTEKLFSTLHVFTDTRSMTLLWPRCSTSMTPSSPPPTIVSFQSSQALKTGRSCMSCSTT